MALRLTGKTLQSSTPAASPPTAAALPAPHRRFHAELTLIDAGMGATAQASESLATRVYVAIATAALDILDETPSEPIILNLAGVALYELWSLDAAQALFRAARRLDSSLPNVEGNLDQVARRKRRG